MRLVCPNCGAQYEVANDAIPDSGRDVQCSNCGHAWFQYRVDETAPKAEAMAPAPEPVVEPVAEPDQSPVDADAADEVARALEEAETEAPFAEDVEPEPDADAPVVALHEDAPAEAEMAPDAAVDEPESPAPEAVADVDDAAAEVPQEAMADAAPAPEPEPEPEVASDPASQDAPAADAVVMAESDPGVAPDDAGANTEAAEVAEADAPAHVDNGDAGADAAAGADGGPEIPAPSSKLDENLLAVLREEAERELSQRRAEAPRPIEVQTELPIDTAAAAAAAAAGTAAVAAVASARGPRAKRDYSYLSSDADDMDDPMPADAFVDPGDADASAKSAGRKGVFPDVEEISSTLRSNSSVAEDDNPMPDLPPLRQQRSSFRRGFALAILLATILLATYVMAPQLSARFPATEPALNAYVASVDNLRVNLRALVARLTGMIEGQA